MIAAYFVIPFLDSVVCADCRGSVPFSGKVALSHLDATHIDVSPSIGNDIDPADASSAGREAKSICSICVNIAAKTYSSYSEPLVAVASQIIQFTNFFPSEPSFSINRPPRNFLAA
jgi:hypothetical protein